MLVKFKLQKEELELKAQTILEESEALAEAFEKKLEAVAKEAKGCASKLAEAKQVLVAVQKDLAAERPTTSTVKDVLGFAAVVLAAMRGSWMQRNSSAWC